MLGVVYIIQNIRNGKCYVGQSKRVSGLVRFKQHISLANRGGGFALHAAIRKYGAENFRLFKELNVDLVYLDQLEQKFVIEYEALCPGGYNLLPYGQLYSGPGYWLGRKRSEATKQKIRDTKALQDSSGERNPFYGKKHSEESLEKMSDGHKKVWAALSDEEKKEWGRRSGEARIGAVFTEERCENISKALVGRKLSKEHCENIRLSKVGRKQPEEAVRKRVKALTGLKRSPEICAKYVQVQRARCTPEQIARAKKIKQMLKEGYKGVEIGPIVGCTPEFVYKIKKGKSYGWLED